VKVGDPVEHAHVDARHVETLLDRSERRTHAIGQHVVGDIVGWMTTGQVVPEPLPPPPCVAEASP